MDLDVVGSSARLYGVDCRVLKCRLCVKQTFIVYIQFTECFIWNSSLLIYVTILFLFMKKLRKHLTLTPVMAGRNALRMR